MEIWEMMNKICKYDILESDDLCHIVEGTYDKKNIICVVYLLPLSRYIYKECKWIIFVMIYNILHKLLAQ